MMKFLVAIAMVALIGFSLTSAAAIDLGDNNVEPGEMDDFKENFKENLQNLIQDVFQQIKENANFEDDSDVESFLQENQIEGEQVSLLTEEEQEEFTNVGPSDAEDDEMGENVESGMGCSWNGRNGTCCQRIKITRVKIHICLVAVIMPPTRMEILITLQGKKLWHHTVGGQGSYRFCAKIRRLQVCFNLYNLQISDHSAGACLSISKPLKKHIGCFSKHFADDEISRAKEETTLQLSEKEENINKLFFVPNEN